jgi:predicted AlkP superfamily phosphohydrolase/phosphomutase
MVASNNGSDRRKVLLIGVDGATFDLIRPWAEAGILPTFRRLMTQGATGELQSVMPPVTPAAWGTLATGMNQGKHGLFDFYARREGSYETMVVDASHRHGASLWQLLSQAGRRTVVFNVPATYPPEPVNGVMVSGLLTPTFATDASQPVELLAELKAAVPNFSFYPPGIFSEGEELKFIEDVLGWDKMTLDATEFLMKREPSWDFLFTVFIGVDIISHFMWKQMETHGASDSTRDPKTREAVAQAIQSVYLQVDSFIAQLMNEAGDDVLVMVVSDHGFGALDHYMHLNAWLAQKGYLKFKRTPLIILKQLMFRLGITPLRLLNLMRALRLGGKVQETASTHNDRLKALVKRAFLSSADVDWSRTTAYSTGYGGPIFVNLKGREPQGIVEPGAEYEKLLERITADLRALRHPDTGEPFVGEIYRQHDLYHGPYSENAPDLQFAPFDWRNQGYGVHDFASNRWLEPSPDRSGTHRMNGVLCLYGKGIEPGRKVEGASLQDIAPTVLALMGVPIPKTMDGQVLSAAFTDEGKAKLSVAFADAVDTPPETRAAADLSPEDEQVIRERLEALGYLG